MRALNLYGLLGVSVVLFGACGGESGLSPDGPGSEAGEAGQGSLPGPFDGGAGGDVGTGGFAGEPSTGGSETGGKNAAGGTGGVGTGGVGAGGIIGKGGAPATGGTPSAGAPGTGGGKSMPNPPDPPEGCEPRSLSVSQFDCYMDMQCDDGQYVQTSCYSNGQGGAPWQCECYSGKSTPQVLSVSGITGGAACTAVANFCVSGEVPNPGPEECMDTGSSRASNYCSISETCTRPFELEGGVQAGFSRTKYVSCSGSGTSQSCSCQNGLQYQLSGQDGTTACDTLIDICDDPSPDFTGEYVCNAQMPVAGGVGYCESQFTCTQTVEVAEGVFATAQDYRYIYCSSQTSSGQGRAVCSCSGNRTSSRFDVEGPVNAQTCGDVLDGCDVSNVELEGPVTCAPAFQQAGSGYCSAQVDCTQKGTVGDLELFLYGSLSTNCQLVDGGYTCSCSTASENEQIDVEASSDWDACSAAIEECPNVVEVKIGEGGGVGIPIPGPIPF